MWTHVDRGRSVKNPIFLFTSYMDDPLQERNDEKYTSLFRYKISRARHFVSRNVLSLELNEFMVAAERVDNRALFQHLDQATENG